MCLRSRLDKLERRGGVGAVCGECGFPPTLEGWHGLVTFHVPPPRIIGEDAPAEDLGRAYCPGCGRQLVFVIPAPRDLCPRSGDLAQPVSRD